MEPVECKCKGCTERFVGCHSTCENYKKFKEYIAYKKAEDYKQKVYDASYSESREMWGETHRRYHYSGRRLR